MSRKAIPILGLLLAVVILGVFGFGFYSSSASSTSTTFNNNNQDKSAPQGNSIVSFMRRSPLQEEESSASDPNVLSAKSASTSNEEPENPDLIQQLEKENAELISLILSKDLQIRSQHERIQHLISSNGNTATFELQNKITQLELTLSRHFDTVTSLETQLKTLKDANEQQQQQQQPVWVQRPFVTLDVDHPKKRGNLVMFKTHKTGSTTLGSIMFRFGAKHGRKFFVPAGHYVEPTKSMDKNITNLNSNIMLNHHHPKGLTTQQLFSFYQTYITNPTFVSVLREPLKRYISAFHYFWEPYTQIKTMKYFLRFREYKNQQATDFGIYTDAQMTQFLGPDGMFNHFGHMLILEHFDESLVLMKRKFGWDLEDILYIRLLESCGGTNWDGLPIKCDPEKEYDDLTLANMRAANNLDYMLYDAYLKRFQDEVAQQDSTFQEEVTTFKAMLKELADFCEKEKETIEKSKYPHQCTKYLINDLGYEDLIRVGKGYANQVLNFPQYRFIEDETSL